MLRKCEIFFKTIIIDELYTGNVKHEYNTDFAVKLIEGLIDSALKICDEKRKTECQIANENQESGPNDTTTSNKENLANSAVI